MSDPQHGRHSQKGQALVVLAVCILAAVAGCGISTAGQPAPAQPVVTPAPTPAPTTSAVPSKYTTAELLFFAAYPSTNPDAALQGGYAICTSLDAGISQAQVIQSVQGMAQISRESAKKVVFAATTYLCPR
jgi:hypothetical protein